MISQVILQNFQSHKSTTVDFADGINMITGISDGGKSAILRAIRWVVHNKPSGDGIISHWAFDKKGKQIEDTSVTLKFDNGDIVTRCKGKGGNTYTVNGQLLEAFGQDVPDLVKTTCRFDETNLQTQMEAPFLLSDSAGEVARFFNRIVKLDKIDHYLSSIEKMKRANRAELTTVNGNLERIEGKLKQFTWLDEAEKVLARVGKLQAKYNEGAAKADAIESTLEGYKEAAAKIKQLEFLDPAQVICDKIKEVSQILRERIEGVNRLTASLDSFEATQKVLDDTQHLPMWLKLVERIRSLLTKQQGLAEKVDDIDLSLATYEQAVAVLANFDKEYKELKDSLPNTCPTCGQEVKL